MLLSRFLAVLLLALTCNSVASASDFEPSPIVADTLEVSSPVCRSTQFRPQQLIFPAAAIAVGSAGIRSHLVDTRGDREKKTFDNTLQYLPTVAYVGLGFIPGVKHEHRIGSRLMAGVTAFAIMTALCQGTKRLVREPRPDTGAKTSFPSGHTATAFVSGANASSSTLARQPAPTFPLGTCCSTGPSARSAATLSAPITATPPRTAYGRLSAFAPGSTNAPPFL